MTPPTATMPTKRIPLTGPRRPAAASPPSDPAAADGGGARARRTARACGAGRVAGEGSGGNGGRAE